MTRLLVDTSLWISYLRESNPQIGNRMESALADATLMTASQSIPVLTSEVPLPFIDLLAVVDALSAHRWIV